MVNSSSQLIRGEDVVIVTLSALGFLLNLCPNKAEVEAGDTFLLVPVPFLFFFELLPRKTAGSSERSSLAVLSKLSMRLSLFPHSRFAFQNYFERKLPIFSAFSLLKSAPAITRSLLLVLIDFTIRGLAEPGKSVRSLT